MLKIRYIVIKMKILLTLIKISEKRHKKRKYSISIVEVSIARLYFKYFFSIYAQKDNVGESDKASIEIGILTYVK